MIVTLCFLPVSFQFVSGEPTTALGWVYWLAVAAVAILLAWEHWLVRPDDLTRVNIAFFNINSIISIGLFVICSIDLLVI